MKIIFLGTGTSQGIPVIGCDCPVCLSTDSRDKRLRVSVLISVGERQIGIDAGPDFRQQMLNAQVTDLDAILLTHEHNDHIIGLDDARPFIFRSRQPMPIFCSKRVAGELRNRFAYAFAANPYPGAPSFGINTTDGQRQFMVGDVPVKIIHYLHGKLPVQGYRIGQFAYLTDIKTLPEAELQHLQNLDILVISALHQKPHHSHVSLTEALELIDRIKPKQAYLTHLSHQMGKHAEVSAMLPPRISIAYDGLELSLPDQ